MPSWTDGRPTDRGDGGRKVLRPLCLFRAVPSLMWIGLVSTPGCGGARAGIEDTNAPSGARLITAEAIAKSGAKTAWDAVRLTVPNVQLREVRGERSEEHTSELQSQSNLVCRLLLEKKNKPDSAHMR